MTLSSTSRFYDSADGLRLHALDFPAKQTSDRLPLVCLPGLTRPAQDFALLGEALAFGRDAPRRVVAFDYRGRGLSDHDPDWRHYDLATERADLLLGLALFGIERAHFIGTSRGGLHIMAMAAAHRPTMRGIILNDIGPVLEIEGLAGIKGYVGKPAAPRSMAEAVALLEAGSGRTFTAMSDEDWRFFATTTFGDDPSDLRTRYDPGLARTLDAFDLDTPLPDNWASFDALRGSPLMVIRGEHSDLLSERTRDAMVQRWPGIRSLEIDGQGHAPLLTQTETISAIGRFLTQADA